MDATRRCLVVGASGKVGRRVCRRLADAGHTVVGAARFSDPARRRELDDLGVETIPFEVTEDDPASLPDVDVVFLEIWDPGRPELIWPINLYGVGRVVARYAGPADFVNGSTGNVYGNVVDPPRRESHLPQPTGDYALSRFAQEKLIDFYCVTAGSKGIHLRYVHSNSEESGVLLRMATSILAGESLGHPDKPVQVIGVEDFARATVLAAEEVTSPPRAINIVHPRVWTNRELGQRLHRELGRGRLVFDAVTGPPSDVAVWDARLMVETFGPPQEDLDALIPRVCRAALATG